MGPARQRRGARDERRSWQVGLREGGRSARRLLVICADKWARNRCLREEAGRTCTAASKRAPGRVRVHARWWRARRVTGRWDR